MASDFTLVLVWGFLGFLYFLPVFLAWSRRCKAIAGVGVVNLFLGWTFIGWVVALAWAACGETNSLPESKPLLTIDRT
jgi:hypothetical protein